MSCMSPRTRLKTSCSASALTLLALCLSISELTSRPTTVPLLPAALASSRSFAAAIRATAPVPVARSSTWSPGCRRRQSCTRICRKCWSRPRDIPLFTESYDAAMRSNMKLMLAAGARALVASATCARTSLPGGLTISTTGFSTSSTKATNARGSTAAALQHQQHPPFTGQQHRQQYLFLPPPSFGLAMALCSHEKPLRVRTTGP
mmetsp:Transcript_124930/g.226700  ORF Transcript_124930/g.226700 Transcript_124930/m.226700 type:complete len:205 (+) Transcript_124930:172-786(+)